MCFRDDTPRSPQTQRKGGPIFIEGGTHFGRRLPQVGRSFQEVSEPPKHQNSRNRYHLDLTFCRGRRRRRFWRWGSEDGKQRVSGRKVFGEDQLLPSLVLWLMTSGPRRLAVIRPGSSDGMVKITTSAKSPLPLRLDFRQGIGGTST